MQDASPTVIPLHPLPPGTTVVIPAYGLQASLDALLRQIPAEVAVVVVDDGSPVPLTASRGTLLRHPRNRGYGAAQKTGYDAALSGGAERVVLLHGDGQYDPLDTLALARALDSADAAFGSRFLGVPPSHIPVWRFAGIKMLCTAANARYRTRYTDLHNGARAWRAPALRRVPYHRFAEDWLFDQQMVCALLGRGLSLVEMAVRMHYDGEILSIPPERAVLYGLRSLREITRFSLPVSLPPWR